MGAPILIEVDKSMIDPVDVAMLEFERDVIPLSVRGDE
jgi:DNA-directed RNA polymerase subunit K